ncbi:MAG: putative capsid protein [Circoviridae sp.]|nr:MAG: putative capsid protein [Circoviridae sp.]
MTYAKKRYNTKKSYKRRKKTNMSNLKSNIKTIVDKQLQRKVETKETGTDSSLYNWNTDNSTMSTPTLLTSCFYIPQGTRNSTRIGDTINVTKAKLKMVLSASSVPLIVQIFIGKLKHDPARLPTPDELREIFQDGGNARAADGSFQSLLRTVNRDMFTIYNYKKIKLGPAASTASGSNNDFDLFRLMNITLKSLMGKVVYSTDGGIVTNKKLFMFCNYVNMDGTTSSFSPKLEWWVDLEYNDL